MTQGLTKLIQKDTGEGSILILPWNYSAITAGTWVFSISGSYAYEYIIYNSSNGLNDQIDFKVYMPAGVWTATMEFYGTTSLAIVGLLIDGTTVTSLDQFDTSGNLYDKWGFNSPFSVSTTGLKTVSLKAIGGRTASYYVYINNLILKRAV